jgi:hypothetical protein
MVKESKVSSWKGFLMTLAATTVSIVLTFGTSAIIDRKKQNAEKREMVMMVMYDMRETLKSVQQCDGQLNAFFEAQLDAVSHPKNFDADYAALALNIPDLQYTTTTENIFRTNIETIRTIGNILFVETVSSFYDQRSRYRKEVADEFQERANVAILSYDNLSAFDTSVLPLLSQALLRNMKGEYEQCKLMMKVTDKDLEVFSVERQKLLEASVADNGAEEGAQIGRSMNQRKEQLRKAREAGREELNQ